MTGSEEDSKPKVIDPNRKVSQFSTTKTTSTNNEQLNQFNTISLVSPTGKSKYHGQASSQYCRDDKVNDLILVDHRHHRSSSTASTSPRSGDRSRSSPVDEDADSGRSGRGRVLSSSRDALDGVVVSSEIDKSVTSSSVVIDEEHANLCLNNEELELISKDEVITLYHRLQDYIDDLKRKHQDELKLAKEIEAKLRVERSELSRREKVVLMRLTTRERQLMEMEKETAVLKSSMVPTLGTLRSTLLDPAVNLIIQKLKKDLTETKKKLEDTQNDLNAWKFTPDSNTGKRLMAKCRMLYLENEDLGKQTSSGRVAKLENDLALNKQLVTEMKRNEAEMDEVVQELDEDIEGLQSAIQHLQQELRSANEKKTTAAVVTGSSSTPPPLMSSPDMTPSELVTHSLPALCAQCRLTQLPAPTPTDGSEGEPEESTALRTTRRESFPSSISSVGGDDEIDESRTRVDLDLPQGSPGPTSSPALSGVENDERTSLLNGESSVDTHPVTTSPFDYIQSVQNIVNSSNSNHSAPLDEDNQDDEDGMVTDPDPVADTPQTHSEIPSVTTDHGHDGPPPKKTKLVDPEDHLDIVDEEMREQNLECHSSSSFNGNGSIIDH